MLRVQYAKPMGPQRRAGSKTGLESLTTVTASDTKDKGAGWGRGGGGVSGGAQAGPRAHLSLALLRQDSGQWLGALGTGQAGQHPQFNHSRSRGGGGLGLLRAEGHVLRGPAAAPRSAKALPEKGASPGNKVTEPTSVINKNYITHYLVLKVFIHVSSSR